MNENSSYGTPVTFFLLGAAVGAGLTLLYAPQPGTETRALIRRKAGETVDSARDLGNRVAQKGAQLRDEALRFKDQVRSAISDELGNAERQARNIGPHA
jgi:gas vesicle protein